MTEQVLNFFAAGSSRSGRQLRRKSSIAKVATAVAVVALGSTVLAACGSGSSDSSDFGVAAGETPQSISLVVRNDLDTFDPAMTAAENGATQSYEALYDTLIRLNLKTKEIEPAMATSWEVTPSKIDFLLKQGLKCSDGSDLLPTDIAKSIERLADPKTGSVYTGRVFGPAGVKAITADNAKNTLSVELNAPHSDLMDGLRSAFIVCPKGLADTEALATTPQGSGPYKLASSKRADTYELERWDSPAVESIKDLPAKLTIRVVTADSTRANLFETGAADIVSVVGRDAGRLAKKYKAIVGKANGTDTVVFNQRPGFPAADEKVRRAVAHALDGKAYVKAASFDVGESVDTLYSPSQQCFDKSNGDFKPKLDLAKAKAELKDAGYGPGAKELTLRLVGYDVQNSGPDYVADAIRKLGVKVEIKNGTLAQAAGIVYGEKEPWDIMVFPTLSSSQTPYPNVTKFSSNLGEGGSYNFGRVHNPTYDAATKKVSAALGEERCKLWSEAEAALLKRTDVVPLMWSSADYFHNGLTFETIYRTIDLRTIRTVGK